MGSDDTTVRVDRHHRCRRRRAATPQDAARRLLCDDRPGRRRLGGDLAGVGSSAGGVHPTVLRRSVDHKRGDVRPAPPLPTVPQQPTRVDAAAAVRPGTGPRRACWVERRRVVVADLPARGSRLRRLPGSPTVVLGLSDDHGCFLLARTRRLRSSRATQFHGGAVSGNEHQCRFNHRLCAVAVLHEPTRSGARDQRGPAAQHPSPPPSPTRSSDHRRPSPSTTRVPACCSPTWWTSRLCRPGCHPPTWSNSSTMFSPTSTR